MQDKTWSEMLSEQIRSLAGDEIEKKVMRDSDELKSPELTVRADWACAAMKRLDNLVPDRDCRWQIVSECACRCQDEFFDEFRDEYRRHGDIDRLIDMLHGRAFLNRPERQGNTIYITKAPKHPNEHAKATTPEEKRFYFCHCDNARATKGEISQTYCFCGAGWCQRIWESILERPVKVEIIETVLQGGDVCKFAVHL